MSAETDALAARILVLEREVRDMQGLLDRWTSRGLDYLALDTLTSHRTLSPGGTPYWLTRQVGGNAQWLANRPAAVDWSDA